MTIKENTYFKTMHQTATEYEHTRAVRQAEKDAIRFPFTDGQVKAYHAWCSSLQNESSVFEVQDLPWNEDIHDFVKTLQAAGIAEFAVTDCSTALMGSLHRLAQEGCTMQGLCKVTRSGSHWIGADTTEYDGILFRT